MTLPPEIRVQSSCSPGCDLSGIIFYLEVRSGTKNPFRIHFPQTDGSGTASITAEEFRGQFADHFEEGFMDYNGTIESADSCVTLSLFDRAQMARQRHLLAAWPLLRHERIRWQSRTEMLDYFLATRNGSFVFVPRALAIPPDGLIQVILQSHVA